MCHIRPGVTGRSFSWLRSLAAAPKHSVSTAAVGSVAVQQGSVQCHTQTVQSTQFKPSCPQVAATLHEHGSARCLGVSGRTRCCLGTRSRSSSART